MSEFKFRVPGFTRPNPQAVSEDTSVGSPTNLHAFSSSMRTKFRITQFVRESRHVDGAKGAPGEEGPAKRSSISAASTVITPAPPALEDNHVKPEDHASRKGSDAVSDILLLQSELREGTPTAATPIASRPVQLAAIRETTPGLTKAKQARRSLPNLKLVPPTHYNPSAGLPEARTPPPIDPSRSVEWNKVVRSIQATSLETIVKKLLDALSDHPESGPGTLVSTLGDIFLDDATKQMYRHIQSLDSRLLSSHPVSSIVPTSVPNGMTPIAPELSTPIPQSAISRLSTPATAQRRSLSGAIPRPMPGGVLIAPKLFEPREYKPNNARKLKRKSEADKDGSISKLLSMKRNASLGELSHIHASPDSLMGGEPPVKRKRGRPKGSTKAAIQERESLKMQATAAEQVSETLTETGTIATDSVSPVLEEEKLLPTGTSIELRAASPSPRPDDTTTPSILPEATP
ncbi:hypothetical protein EYR41_005386 [Orbilia oligospora]|uniref:Uncharacterized protein n=1 Tax=Orbilia oligospora TaxID=2813651 RepID=A0A7C8KIS2_ORBOL|nr:hypothetical protein TWF751_007781 [Orbilia oligospora]TGJ69334.1 hypothetical protein EYR41_005386 [Orbilia oligospora]